jgi:hypothetical protein
MKKQQLALFLRRKGSTCTVEKESLARRRTAFWDLCPLLIPPGRAKCPGGVLFLPIGNKTRPT